MNLTKRVLHLYDLSARGCNIIFVVAIDPISALPGLYNFLLFTKAGSIERRICAPVQLKLAFDPQNAEFDVCLTPKENSLPPNSHYSIRIWIRRSASISEFGTSSENGPLSTIYRHRLFSHDDFFIARFPLDIYAKLPRPSSPADPSARLGSASKDKRASQNMKIGPAQTTLLATPEDISDRKHVLVAKVSGVSIRYTVVISPVQPNVIDAFEYLLSLEYEAGGITRFLFRNLDLRITCPLSALGFTLYTTFIRQTTTGSLHHLALWICSPQVRSSNSSVLPSEAGEMGGVCQRLWRTDSFLVTSPVLPLPRSASTLSLPGMGQDGMILAQRHARSPLSVDLPSPTPGANPFIGADNGIQDEKKKNKETEAKEQEAWEWDRTSSDLPAYAYSQSIHGHSGAFDNE